MEGDRASIEEELTALKEEMTEGQLEQAEKVWNSYLEERLEKGLGEKENAANCSQTVPI